MINCKTEYKKEEPCTNRKDPKISKWVSFVKPLLGQSTGDTILPVLNPPPVSWFWSCIGLVRLAHSTLCLPEALPHLVHKLPALAHGQAASPTLQLPWATYLLAGSDPKLTVCAQPTHFRGEFWWWATGASSNCNISWADHGGAEGLRRPTASFATIWDFQRKPQVQHWHVTWLCIGRMKICSLYPSDSLGLCSTQFSYHWKVLPAMESYKQLAGSPRPWGALVLFAQLPQVQYSG